MIPKAWLVPSALLLSFLLPSAARLESAGQVQIRAFAFAPDTLTVKAGTEVAFVNEDHTLHSVVSDHSQFASDALEEGEGFGVTLSRPGDYPFHCGIHTRMKGVVVVLP